MLVHPIFKVPGLLLVAAGYHVASTPPHSPSNGNDTIEPSSSERIVRTLLRMGLLGYIKASFWCLSFAECAVILAEMFPSLSISQKTFKCLMFGSGAGQVRFTVATALGITLALGGSALRAWCFRELGKYFTFEITIQKDHKLVTTGPYSIIRHPSYTGIIMLMASAAFLTMTKGSWVRESGLLSGLLGQILVGVFALATGVGNAALLLRIKDEERELRKRFGKEWDRWAAKVYIRLST